MRRITETDLRELHAVFLIFFMPPLIPHSHYSPPIPRTSSGIRSMFLRNSLGVSYLPLQKKGLTQGQADVRNAASKGTEHTARTQQPSWIT